MRLKPEIWSEAVQFRCHLASEYRKYHESSDATAARDLTDLAVSLKLTDRNKPIHGATLAKYVSKVTEMPYWAAMAAIVFILERGYQAQEKHHLDYLVAHIAKDRLKEDAITTAFCLFQSIDKNEIIDSINRISDGGR